MQHGVGAAQHDHEAEEAQQDGEAVEKGAQVAAGIVTEHLAAVSKLARGSGGEEAVIRVAEDEQRQQDDRQEQPAVSHEILDDLLSGGKAGTQEKGNDAAGEGDDDGKAFAAFLFPGRHSRISVRATQNKMQQLMKTI